jgi:branched-chain amino acid transport system permease protein
VSVFAAQVINGIVVGSIYALIVLGTNLLIVVRQVVHFGYAHIVMVSMAIGWLVLAHTNENLVLGILVIIIGGTAITIFTEPLFRRLVASKSFLETVVVAQGVAIILTDAVSHFFNKGVPMGFPQTLYGGGGMIQLGLISFSLANIYVIAVGIVAVMLLMYFLYRTRQGRAIRAMAQNTEIAKVLGIPFGRTGIYGFAVAGILAGLVGVLMAMSIGSVSAELGDSYAVKGMILVLFAGMGNLKGGLISAVVMGIAESMAIFYLPGRWSQAAFFGILMLVILWRPQGLFGSRT